MLGHSRLRRGDKHWPPIFRRRRLHRRGPRRLIFRRRFLYNWTGFYLGGNVGGVFSGLSASDTLGSSFANTTSQSFLGGGQVGVNYQFWGGLVIGAEADFDWLPNTKNTITATPPAGAPTATTAINNRWLTLVDARVGYAWDRLLVYGKGGGAFAGVSNSNGTVGTTVVNISSPGSNSGWTAGAGLEYAFWSTWSVRAEYDFVRLNAVSYTLPRRRLPRLPAIQSRPTIGNSTSSRSG